MWKVTASLWMLLPLQHVMAAEHVAPIGVPACPAPGCVLPRNFDAVYPRKDLQDDALAAHLAAGEVARPWYLSPYRNYSYFRPWYTYGYGPRWYPYHYSPSWGYHQPWYGPQYLNPDAIAPSRGEQLYHW